MVFNGSQTNSLRYRKPSEPLTRKGTACRAPTVVCGGQLTRRAITRETTGRQDACAPSKANAGTRPAMPYCSTLEDQSESELELATLLFRSVSAEVHAVEVVHRTEAVQVIE